MDTGWPDRKALHGKRLPDQADLHILADANMAGQSEPHQIASLPIAQALMMQPRADGIDVPGWVGDGPQGRAVMSEIVTVGLDPAKTVFQVRGGSVAQMA